MLVKVCGLRDPENIRQVAAIPGVDMVGLIFYPSSPRFVDSEATALSVASLTTVKTAGVFVNEEKKVIVRKCLQYQLGCIQLHGNEQPEYLAKLRSMLPAGIKIIKACSIKTEEDILQTSGYEEHCEYLLFDTSTTGYGGSGRTFDWNILQYYSGETPFLLSGGIGPESITALHRFQHRKWAGIDLNSRFETAPGIKNTGILTTFVQKIKSDTP